MASATITKAQAEECSEAQFTLEDLPGLCRLCLKKNEILSNMELSLREFYQRCMERSMEVKDELPAKICEKCNSYLNSIDNFIKETKRNRQYKHDLSTQGIDFDSLDKESKAELKHKLQSIKEDPEGEKKPKKPKLDSDVVKEESYELQEEVVEIKDEDGDSDEDVDGDLEEDELDDEGELDDEDEDEDEDEDVGLDSDDEEDEEEDEDEGEEDSDDE